MNLLYKKKSMTTKNVKKYKSHFVNFDVRGAKVNRVTLANNAK